MAELNAEAQMVADGRCLGQDGSHNSDKQKILQEHIRSL